MMPAIQRRGKWFSILMGLFYTAVLSGCFAPHSFMQASSPRPGQALNRRVAVVYSRNYQIRLGGAERLHSFDIHKYAKIYLQLNTSGLLRPADVFVPQAVTREDLLRVHTPAYLATLTNSRRVAGYLEAPILAAVPACLVDLGILNAFRYATGGTILAGRLALKYGIAVNLAGGYHHAEPDDGGGFCVFADMPIAIRTLRAEGLIRRALVVDLDVHQGNGTAECFKNDKSVFTFSIQEEGIYPQPRSRSTLDIDLPAGTGDEEYLRVLRRHLPDVLDQSKPDIVFLQAGCDTLAGDPLAGLRMTRDGIVRRDAIVIDECVRRGIPVVMVLGGGYSPQAWAVQYASIRRTLLKYGLSGRPAYPSRKATIKEKLYAM